MNRIKKEELKIKKLGIRLLIFNSVQKNMQTWKLL